jgi:dolichol-phosphate mannosyltransferase
MSELIRPHISVAVPVYACGCCLPDLYSRLRDTLEKITPHFEILLVNDCSPDNAWEVIRGLCERDPRVKGIDFSRNFGRRAIRKDGFFKRFSSRVFNWLLGVLMGQTLDPATANFGI